MKRGTRLASWVRGLGAVAVSTVVLAACGGGDGEAGDAAAEDEQVSLSFLGPQSATALEPVIAAFEEQHPNIDVTYESVPFAEFNDIIQTRLGAGDALPDIYTADQPRMQALVARDFLLDLTDLVEVPDGMFLDHTIEASSVDGRLYALPSSTSTAVMYYNIDLLEQAGVEPPSNDPEQRPTWEEMVEAARLSQEAGAQWGLMLDQVSRIYQFLPLAESLGGGSGVTGPDDLEPAVMNDDWIEAATFYGSLYADELAPRGVAGPQTVDLFANGQLAFFVGGPWHHIVFDEQDDLNYGIAAHPYFEGGEPVTPTGGYSRGINPNSQFQEEALQFIEFETMSTEGAVLSSEGQPIPPANVEALEEYLNRPVWQREETEGAADLMRHELTTTARLRPPTAGYVVFEDIMGATLEDIANGAEPAVALEGASEQLVDAWARLGRG